MSSLRIITLKEAEKFARKYLTVITEDYHDKYMDFLLGRTKFFEVPLNLINEWDIEKERREKQNRLLSQTTELNNKGIAFEKSGDIDSAIKMYEKNISLGFPASHSYSRLMVIYRKARRFDDEIRVIDRAIEVYTIAKIDEPISGWEQRRAKAIELRDNKKGS